MGSKLFHKTYLAMNHHDHSQVKDLDDRLLTVALVVIGSFAMGLIPLVYGLRATTPQGQTIIPTEAALWISAGPETE
jgi:hypothetical protein